MTAPAGAPAPAGQGKKAGTGAAAPSTSQTQVIRPPGARPAGHAHSKSQVPNEAAKVAADADGAGAGGERVGAQSAVTSTGKVINAPPPRPQPPKGLNRGSTKDLAAALAADKDKDKDKDGVAGGSPPSTSPQNASSPLAAAAAAAAAAPVEEKKPLVVSPPSNNNKHARIMSTFENEITYPSVHKDDNKQMDQIYENKMIPLGKLKILPPSSLRVVLCCVLLTSADVWCAVCSQSR